MSGQIYLYDVTYILADGRILERYGLVAAENMSCAFKKLDGLYSNLDSVSIKQLDCGPYEIDEETWLSFVEDI